MQQPVTLRPPYGNLATVDPANVAVHLIPVGARTIYLGAWGLGTPSGETGLSDLPTFKLPPEPGEAALKDLRRAEALLFLGPRRLFDATVAARTLTIAMRREHAALTGQGYDDFLAAVQLGPRLAEAFAELNGEANAAAEQRDRTEQAYAEAAGYFPPDGESEVQAVMFDASIVAKLAPLSAEDLATLRNGLLPTKFGGARGVHALMRVPRAVTGLTDEEVELVRDAYVRAFAPCTDQAVRYMRGAVELARVALAATALELARMMLVTPEEGFKILDQGDWLAPAAWKTGATSTELRELRQAAAAAAERRHAQAVKATPWRPPAG